MTEEVGGVLSSPVVTRYLLQPGVMAITIVAMVYGVQQIERGTVVEGLRPGFQLVS